ncbi:hypothetical protein A0H81_07613 [Grifola frondosa]|uniref:DUF6535 domain-containing protein n=1 Tax=Grifola frondosa TaxID=5627 RepID=A0A1C7M5Z0_GRIFR|nr:hypothetical protein A0H81_07613 [Grifola frondosa]
MSIETSSISGSANFSKVPHGTSGDSFEWWSSCASLMKRHDEAMVRGWKEEIDTLLVFAGLFSAVLTAFNVEAYKLLQDDPTEISARLLAQISIQLAEISAGQTAAANFTGSMTSNSFRASPASIRINALWFSSLVCSLVSALIAILAKQWLREYMDEGSLSPRESVRLRQHRFDGLTTWRVAGIMGFLPLLLEISLVLFFIGLVDFLRTLHPTVAGIVSSLVAMSLFFYVATTLIPAFSTSCPFKSPQSWVFYQVSLRARRWYQTAYPQHTLATSSSISSPPSWRERDGDIVQSSGHALDLRALVWSHSASMDDEFLDSLIQSIHELDPENAAQLVYEMLAKLTDCSAFALMYDVRARACEERLRDVVQRAPMRPLERVVHALLELLSGIPRDRDPSKLGPLDILYTLWNLFIDQVTLLVKEHEPYRLRRAAVNFLWEHTQELASISSIYCPPTIGDVIACARASHQYPVPEMFVKASAVAVVLASALDWNSPRADVHERKQLEELLQDLGRFFWQCNEDGVPYDKRAASKIVVGRGRSRSVMARSWTGAELGLVEFSLEEHLALHRMQQICGTVRHPTARSFGLSQAQA